MILILSYRLEVLVIISTLIFHGLSYLIFVRNIYPNYHNTIIDGHIYVILLVILDNLFNYRTRVDMLIIQFLV